MREKFQKVSGDAMEKAKQKRQPLITNSRSTKTRRKSTADYYDFNLVAVIVLLTCFGLIMLYSTSAYTAQMQYNDDMFYFKKQAIVSVVCIVVALVISRIDYHILTFFTTILYGVAILLMVLVKTPLGVTSHGARRWLQLGPIQFQPAEVAKIAVIVCLSYMIVQMGRQVRTLKACMVLGSMGGLLALIAYVFTDNLSTAIIIFCITAGLIFIAHPDMRPFIIIAGVAAVLVVLLVVVLSSTMENSDNFRIQRILVWLHPEDYASGDGYQTLQALYAIGSGGLFGTGLGGSIQKLGFVPEAQNDMIFSIICEELGLFGAGILLLLFLLLIWRFFLIAVHAPDLFGSLLAAGVMAHIAIQVILNVAVVTNTIPNTGITLPFVSYGGTSILFLLAEMGLVLGISRKCKGTDFS